MLDRLQRLGGPHFWTVVPRLRHSWRPRQAPPAEPWQGVVQDPAVGPVRLSGRLRRVPRAGDELVVLVHGLGGTIESHYMVRGALAAERAGLSCFRLSLRGADLCGEDFYHAGLTADVHAALASPELRRYRRIYLLGYSLGGHLVLRFATEPGDERVVRAAAVCSPLDLSRSQEEIDRPSRWLYRRYLLANLMKVAAAVAARGRLPLPLAEVARFRKIRDFDERVVAPRHGFTGADDYYARASVAPRLAELRLPALLLNAARDPMIAAAAVRPVLEGPVPRLTVRWAAQGGHVAFPPGIDLGLQALTAPRGHAEARAGGPGGRDRAERQQARRQEIDDQVLAWLRHA